MADQNQYLGNPNLKKTNTVVEFTKDDIKEYHKCAQDPLYFIENYVQIVSLDEGLVPFEMYDFQKAWFRPCMITDFLFLSYPDSLANPPSLSVIFYITLYSDKMLILRFSQTNRQPQEIF